MIEGETCIP